MGHQLQQGLVGYSLRTIPIQVLITSPKAASAAAALGLTDDVHILDGAVDFRRVEGATVLAVHVLDTCLQADDTANGFLS
jgi:hypothetical protein